MPPQRRDRNLTIVQGDAHVWNCCLLRDGGADVRFFAWDSWRVNVGASDLAYMMAVHWYPDRRRLFEALLAAGVRGYDRASLVKAGQRRVGAEVGPDQACGVRLGE